MERFEDIEAWQKARELTREIYAVTVNGPFSKDFGLRGQIRRAAVSAMSNIAEGFGRCGNKGFSQFLSRARGSIAEVQTQLYVALDAGY
ncbi:MAG: four helix bundle protein [Deltaproteobacteria bacterium]|nr:four helix bundle protein [Deltaproteobacteria bacterium]